MHNLGEFTTAKQFCAQSRLNWYKKVERRLFRTLIAPSSDPVRNDTEFWDKNSL